MGVRGGVLVDANRGWHVDDSFDQFCLLEIRHGVEAALELSTGQPLAMPERWNRLSYRCGCRMSIFCDGHESSLLTKAARDSLTPSIDLSRAEDWRARGRPRSPRSRARRPRHSAWDAVGARRGAAPS